MQFCGAAQVHRDQTEQFPNTSRTQRPNIHKANEKRATTNYVCTRNTSRVGYVHEVQIQQHPVSSVGDVKQLNHVVFERTNQSAVSAEASWQAGRGFLIVTGVTYMQHICNYNNFPQL